ncbi:MAG: PIG-L family deacetylase, partial [Armatimonadetes bacterium]|nr:PIG-L family deacetylase [Armatimonadota bacterium]
MDSPMKIAVLASHPDDEVIAMGALLVAISDDVHSLHLVWMTGGEGSVSA